MFQVIHGLSRCGGQQVAPVGLAAALCAAASNSMYGQFEKLQPFQYHTMIDEQQHYHSIYGMAAHVLAAC
jgi:hypothetical protein